MARPLSRSVLAAAMLIIVTQTSALQARAEIPHENFDLVSSDLEMVVDLLNTSINYSEQSLVALYYTRIADADENLSVVTGLLKPVERLIANISGIADSYESLIGLVPPFSALAEQEHSFVGLEAELLDKRSVIVQLSEKTNLTQEETLLAVSTINEATALIALMNERIDVMLETASVISSLEVAGEMPFANNSLAELIEWLRDMLLSVEAQLVDFIDASGDDLWQDVEPFLTLWVAEDSYYLEDELSGGGYLFFDGLFRPGYEVEIRFDGIEILAVTTSDYGRYEFSFEIPPSEGWLGLHMLVASSSPYFGEVSSEPFSVLISRIPTTVSLWVESDVLSPTEELHVVATVEDVRGKPVSGGSCTLWVDLAGHELVTNGSGQIGWTTGADVLGYGRHSLFAEFEASIPYESSVSGRRNITVDVPTALELNLFASRVYTGYYIVGDGSLAANGSGPLGGMTVTLSIDGVEVMNVTTRLDGGFAFTLESRDLSAGAHMLLAEFIYKPEVWRYASDQSAFTVFTTQRTIDYPFWPIVPGWGGGGAPEQAVNVFFGDYAYLTWLVVVIIGAAAVKTLQLRHALLEKRYERARRSREASAQFATAGAPASEEFVVGAADESPEPPRDPNNRIVWEYNSLMKFLSSKRKVALRRSMTHWEIARVLKAIGYPLGLIESVTRLFETAFYSGLRVQASDMESMVEYSSKLKSIEKVGDGSAS